MATDEMYELAMNKSSCKHFGPDSVNLWKTETPNRRHTGLFGRETGRESRKAVTTRRKLERESGGVASSELCDYQATQGLFRRSI